MPDLEAVRGDTNVFNVVVLRLDNPVNIQGAKAWFTAKRALTDADDAAVITLDTDTGGVEITNGLKGLIQVAIPPEDTADLTEETVLYYDVQLKELSGTVTTIAEGKLRVVEDVTRATV